MYQVDGFDFETIEQADAAKRELEGIKYIRSQTKMDDLQTVLRLYDKLITKKVFSTPVGYQFLYEIQEYLKNSKVIRPEQIHRIPVHPVPTGGGESAGSRLEVVRQTNKLRAVQKELAEERRLNKNRRDYKKAFRGTLAFAVFCVVIVIGMFVITGMSEDNVNIINYENEILDKYEHWEKRLKEREAQIEEREEKLGIASPDWEEDGASADDSQTE